YIAADARQLLDAGKARLSADSSDSDGLAMVRKAQKRWLQALHLQPDNTFYLESYAAFLDQVPGLGGRDPHAIQIRDLRRAAAINPWQPRYARNLANVYANESKFDTATAVLEHERSYTPRDTALLDQLAKFYEHAGKHAKALAVWRQVHQIDPKDDAANQALGT